MSDLNLQTLHEVVGGRLRLATLVPRHDERTPVGRIVTDSRQVAAGDVFWALSGTQQDGGSFAEDAYRRGASGVVVASRYVQPAPGCWSLQVEDSLVALGELASWNRQRFGGTVIGVTGSVGKTTTRQMIDAGSGGGPALFVVSDITKLRAYVNVPQNYVPSVKLGAKAQLSVPEYKGKNFTAIVEASAQSVDVAT